MRSIPADHPDKYIQDLYEKMIANNHLNTKTSEDICVIIPTYAYNNLCSWLEVDSIPNPCDLTEFSECNKWHELNVST